MFALIIGKENLEKNTYMLSTFDLKYIAWKYVCFKNLMLGGGVCILLN